MWGLEVYDRCALGSWRSPRRPHRVSQGLGFGWGWAEEAGWCVGARGVRRVRVGLVEVSSTSTPSFTPIRQRIARVSPWVGPSGWDGVSGGWRPTGAPHVQRARRHHHVAGRQMHAAAPPPVAVHLQVLRGHVLRQRVRGRRHPHAQMTHLCMCGLVLFRGGAGAQCMRAMEPSREDNYRVRQLPLTKKGFRRRRKAGFTQR